MVFEAERLHRRRREQIAAVEDQRPRHGIMNALPIQKAKLVPFGAYQEGVGSFGGLVGVASASQFRPGGPRVLNSSRIISADSRPIVNQVAPAGDGGRAANIVSIRFVGQAKEADALVFQDPKSTACFF